MSDPRRSPKPVPAEFKASEQETLHAFAQNMVRRVEAQQSRMLRARGERNHDLFRSLALLGVVGWSITFPTLAGVALGIWIDQRWPSRFSATLTCLLLGMGIGCVNAWAHIRPYLKLHSKNGPKE